MGKAKFLNLEINFLLKKMNKQLMLRSTRIGFYGKKNRVNRDLTNLVVSIALQLIATLSSFVFSVQTRTCYHLIKIFSRWKNKKDARTDQNSF